jgi:hypothetical protein
VGAQIQTSRLGIACADRAQLTGVRDQTGRLDSCSPGASARRRPYIPARARMSSTSAAATGPCFALSERQDRIRESALTPRAVPRTTHGSFRFIQGYAPGVASRPATATTPSRLLAVLEHIPLRSATACLPRRVCHAPATSRTWSCARCRHHKVDSLIHIGQRLRLLDGIAEHEHYGFEPGDTVGLFTDSGFRLLLHRRFQLGLNHLFVFARAGDGPRSTPRS